MNPVAVKRLPRSPATLEDLLALPDSGHGYEIIDGDLVEKQASAEHGMAQSALSGVLHRPFQLRSGGPPERPGGWWFASEVLIDFGAGQKFRPDLAGWRRERVPTQPAGPVITLIPDWICEVISPGNASNDTVKKLRAYHKTQVAHYWLLDPASQALLVLRHTPAGYLHVLSAERGERVRAEPFDAIELQIGVLFGDDEED